MSNLETLPMSLRQFIHVVIVCVFATPVVSAQQQAVDDVIRIDTELVQTRVVVVDKQGRFVDGLRQEQFVLKVDGQPLLPVFFERVIAGTAKLEKSGGKPEASASAADDSRASYRGRTVIFFVDDLHLSAESMLRIRKDMLEFVDREMTPEDQVLVVSPTGQLGFLQSFTDVKPVVRAAVNRLVHKPYSIRDHERVPMTEYQAVRINEGDHSTTHYFVTKLLEANNYKVPGGIGPPSGGPVAAPPRGGAAAGMREEAARRVVKNRAGLIVRQSESITNGTLTALESLTRFVSHAPGRKVVLFISDGFFLNDSSTGVSDRLDRISDAAMRGDIVIYSLDARGVFSTSDAASNRADPQGNLDRANMGALVASQHGMNALASDTGGKAFFNSTVPDAVKEALEETSNYYLLAWRPTAEHQKSQSLKRLEVSVAGRPELTVRVARRFFVSEPQAEVKKSDSSINDSDSARARNQEGALVSALVAPSARTGISTKLSVSFVDVPGSGLVLTAAAQLVTDGLDYGADGKQAAVIDLAGVVFNDQGKRAGSFKTRMNVSPTSRLAPVKDPAVVYNHKLPLAPGIYQVRVAARDDKSGRVGSAAQWIEIPDLNSKQLALATLLLSGQVGSEQANQAQAEQVQFSVDRRFTRESQLNFLTIIYNSALSPGDGSPRLESKIEIFRHGQPVLASPVRELAIEPNTDLARIPYGASIALRNFTSGRYVLRVTITDRKANKQTFSEILFEVE